MGAILIGDAAVPIIQKLSSTLKSKTNEQAHILDSLEHNNYSPWLCSRPILSEGISNLNILMTEYPKGEFVKDVKYLQAVSGFLNGEIKFSFESMPGGPDQWQVCTDDAAWLSGVADDFNKGRNILFLSPFFRKMYEVLVEMVIPIDRPHSSGFSSHLARGVIFRSFPQDHSSLSIAVDLAHEIGHQALMVFQSVDPILISDPQAPVYSEIRHADRPAIQSVHATVALAYMTLFEDEMKEQGLVESIHDDRILRYGGTLRQSLKKAISSLNKECKFTDLGSQIMREFSELSEA